MQTGKTTIGGVIRDIHWTPSERRVVVAAANGLSAEATARLHHLSVYTVKSHRKNLIRRWGARDITHVVAVAFRACLLHSDDIAGGPIPLARASHATTS